MCGLTLAGFMAIGWLITVFGPQSAMIRLGAGVLRGITSTRQEPVTPLPANGSPATPTTERGGRGTALFTIWIIVTLALCALPLLGMPISWTPLA